MELWQIALLVIVIAAAGIALAVLYRQRMRTQELSGRFGPEYRHALEQAGDRMTAEKELLEREARVRAMTIRPLTTEERDRFAPAWRSVQARFVDDPSRSLAEADRLVTELMATRGYEVGEDFERMAADVSVDHAQVVGEYREAHAIAERQAANGVETEELRQAMVHYRALFDDLLEVGEPELVGARS